MFAYFPDLCYITFIVLEFWEFRISPTKSTRMKVRPKLRWTMECASVILASSIYFPFIWEICPHGLLGELSMPPSALCISGVVLILEMEHETWAKASSTACSWMSEGVGKKWASDEGPVRAGRGRCAVHGVNSPFVKSWSWKHMGSLVLPHSIRVKAPQRQSQGRKGERRNEGDKSKLHMK